MPLMSFSLACLFLMKFFIQPTTCAVSKNIQTVEPADIISLPNKFLSIIDKIIEIGMLLTYNKKQGHTFEGHFKTNIFLAKRLRCPKGWKRLGGSCYYFSNLTSISSHANHTCNHLHSNLSNLMQIRNAVELFYAAHVLSRNNLSSLMIDIDPNLLQGKKITEMLRNDQGRWKRMRKKFPEEHVKYQNLTKYIRDRLSSIDLQITRRSRKLQRSSKDSKLNDTTMNNDEYEYEYDDFMSSDERDEFEQINDIRGICDDIHWNLLNNNKNSTVYILTTYNIADKIVCSLSDVDPQTKYYHVCEYVLDFCFANIVCGKHGRCDNTLTSFKCSCSFLYGGVFCEKFTQQGIQIIIGIVIIICIGPILGLISFIIDLLIRRVRKKQRKERKRRNKNARENNDQPQPLVHLLNTYQVENGIENQPVRIITINNQEPPKETLRNIKVPSPSSNPMKSGLTRSILVWSLAIIILVTLYLMITLRYYTLFKMDANGNINLENLLNDTSHLVRECARISDYKMENLVFGPCAGALILFFSFLVKRKKRCLRVCGGRPGLLPPINPFRMENRLATATVFGILAFEVLKIFEQLLFSLSDPVNLGVLIELCFKITTIFLIGVRYYPVLASLHLYNIVTRFLTCLYIIANIIYTIFREGSCMGYLPLSGQYAALEEAKLRIELGTWFIIYGLIKHTPQFFFFSYIGAELCVRFAYDSIYVLKKKEHRSIWSVPDQHVDNSEFAKRYVKNLLRSRCRQPQVFTLPNTDINRPTDNESEYEQQNKLKQSWFKKRISSIYVWDDDFRFTTMIVCTYTVAVVSLHYLACTFVFLYISRTTEHVGFLKSLVESSANTELQTILSKFEIIISAILAIIIYGIQLLIGLQYYKDDKNELLEETNKKIRSRQYFKRNSEASKSIRYCGFLVGYVAWGFVICFHLILLIFIGIRMLRLQTRHGQSALNIIVPVIIIYLLRNVSTRKATKYLFIQEKEKKDEKRKLKNTGNHAVVIYFMFFADCLIGIASCIIRLITATLANVICMSRLDYSFLGRSLSKYDPGYAAYISYLRLEVTYTHPIQIAFCSLCWDAIHRQPRTYYDEECCTLVEDDDRCEEPREYPFQKNRTNSFSNTCRRNPTKDESMQNINHNHHESRTKRTSKTSSRPQQNDSSTVIIRKNNPIRDKYNRTDNEIGLSIPEIMPTRIPQNSTVKTDDKKSEQQTSNISNNQVKVDENDDSSTSGALSSSRQQPQLSKPSSNITKAITHQEPSPKRGQSDDGIYDDDGGPKPKSYSTIAKLIAQPQPILKSSTPSSKVNINNPTDDEEDDEDGGVTVSKIIKQKQKTEAKKVKNNDLKKKKQPNTTEDLVDEDEDGGMSTRKHKSKEIKTKKKSTFARCFQDQDDDGVPKRKKSIKKKPSNKSNIPKKDETDEDEDGGRAVKTYGTIRKIIPPNQSVLNNSRAKDQSSTDNTDDNAIQSFKHPKDTTSTSVDTSNRQASKISVDSRNMKPKKTPDKYHYKIVPKEDEQVAQTITIDSSPLNSQTSFDNKLYFLRTISYYKAQQRSPPTMSQRQINFSLLRNRNDTNDHDNHYSEIRNDTIRSSVSNPLYFIIKAIQSLSSYSSEQQNLTEENHTEVLNKRQRMKWKKIARTRWYLAYTIIHNPCLAKYRKTKLAEKKLRRRCSHLNPDDLTPVTTDQESVSTTDSMKPETLRSRRIRAKTTASAEAQPPTVLRLLPMPNSDDDSQKPLTQPVTIRSQMLNNADIQRATIYHSISMQQVSTTNVCPQENANSSILCIETSHTQHMRTVDISEVKTT